MGQWQDALLAPGPTADDRGLVFDDVSAQTSSGSLADNRQRLRDGVLYSGPFILTYQCVLVGIVLAFTVRHWLVKFLRWRSRNTRRKQILKDDGKGGEQRSPGHDGEPSSSSSSTLSGNAKPPDASKQTVSRDEQTPLLASRDNKPPRSFMRAIRAIGMYQPPAIPITGQAPPSVSTIVLVLFFLGLNVFYALYNIHFEMVLSFVFADRAGRLFVANLPWLYLFAAKNQPLRFLTGYSYENLNILHRRLGEILCLLAVFHGAFMLVTWYMFFRPLGEGFLQFLTHKVIWLGLLAFVAYELLFLTSLASFREWWYEMFLGSHIVLQTAGLVLVYFHHPGGRVYTVVALAIFLIDRLVFRLIAKTRSVRADLTVMEDRDTVMVSANWPVTSRWSKFWTSLFGLNTAYGWQPTEHIFLTVPAMARKHIIQAHPFTIASAAPEGDEQHAWFNLIIRAHNGFSRDLVRYAQNHTSAMIRMDGPYGSFHALDMVRDSDVAVVVVGGSGIAVAYPMIWTLLHDHIRDAEAVHSGRKVGLIWVVHEASHISWIGHERLDELKEKGLHVCIPAPTSKAGRPDVGNLAKEMINDLTNEGRVRDPRIGVVVSGPDGMNKAVRNTCASMAWQGWDVDVAVEKYGW